MSRVRSLSISSNGMAFDPQTGDSFQLNESAKLIIHHLQKGLSSEEVAKKLAFTFNTTYEKALTDVLEFQVQIEALGLAA